MSHVNERGTLVITKADMQAMADRGRALLREKREKDRAERHPILKRSDADLNDKARRESRNPVTGKWWPPWKTYTPPKTPGTRYRFTTADSTLGGKARTYVKRRAARINGALGGRPRIYERHEPRQRPAYAVPS